MMDLSRDRTVKNLLGHYLLAKTLDSRNLNLSIAVIHQKILLSADCTK